MPTSRYKCSLLAVDDEPAVLALLANQLGGEFEVATACTAEQAKAALAGGGVDIVLTDLQLPDASGIHLLDWVFRTAPRTARVLITGTAKIQDAADAINNCHVHRLILKPWRGEDLLAQLRDVARGLLLERSHERLLEEMRTVNQRLEERVKDRTRDLQASNQILERMALTDPLTGLPNRRAIDLIARQEVSRRARARSALCVGLIDADRFKQINSDHTLTGGDVVLCALARTLQQTLRGSDAVGRVGGEEFMLVAPDTDATGAESLAERVRAAVAEARPEYNGAAVPVTVSGGFAVAEARTAATFEQLRELAATALAEAKATGRNRCVVRLFPTDGTAVPPVGNA